MRGVIHACACTQGSSRAFRLVPCANTVQLFYLHMWYGVLNGFDGTPAGGGGERGHHPLASHRSGLCASPGAVRTPPCRKPGGLLTSVGCSADLACIAAGTEGAAGAVHRLHAPGGHPPEHALAPSAPISKWMEECYCALWRRHKPALAVDETGGAHIVLRMKKPYANPPFRGPGTCRS